MHRITLILLLASAACMEQGYQSETFEPRTVQPELDLPIVDPTEERFYDPANRPVNMIFAIDRSGSMGL